MRFLFLIVTLLLAEGKVYGGNNMDSSTVTAVRPVNSQIGVVYFVHENGNLVTHFNFMNHHLYRLIFSSPLSSLSRKQLMQFIEKVRQESRIAKLKVLVYQRLLDIALSPDVTATVRVHAIETLTEADLKRSDFYRALAKALMPSLTPPSVRKAIAQYLEKIKPKDPIVSENLTLTLLHDPKPFVRKASALALGAIQPEDSLIVGKLRYSAVGDKNGGVQQAALTALRSIKEIRCSKAFDRS